MPFLCGHVFPKLSGIADMMGVVREKHGFFIPSPPQFANCYILRTSVPLWYMAKAIDKEAAAASYR